MNKFTSTLVPDEQNITLCFQIYVNISFCKQNRPRTILSSELKYCCLDPGAYVVCTYPTIRVSTGGGAVAEGERWTAQAAKPAARSRAAKAAPHSPGVHRTNLPFPLLPLFKAAPTLASAATPTQPSHKTTVPSSVRRRPGRKPGSRAGKLPLPFRRSPP
jgi:hypothetical protein